MSDTQKLKDSITEYRKANKNLDDKLMEIENLHRQNQQELEEQSTHRS